MTRAFCSLHGHYLFIPCIYEDTTSFNPFHFALHSYINRASYFLHLMRSDPQKSASRFVVTEDGQQFYMTGDIAFRDENGYYHFKVHRVIIIFAS